MRLVATILVSLLVSSTVVAEDWRRFENSNFIAFSNGESDDVIAVLTELELVRAAASQTPGFFLPEDNPRTLVVLPATLAEFSHLAPFETMAGFAQPLDDRSAIVLPATGGGADARVIARHEFAHTMLFNEWFDYPHWYAEGFAEVVSSINVNWRRKHFTIGEKPERYGRRIRPRIDWEELIGTDFDAHNLADPALVQSAYAQNWVLIHYLILNGEKDFTAELDHYFSRVTSGASSASAFTAAFGDSASALWDSNLKSYSRRPPTTRRDFDTSGLDLQFDVRKADDDVFRPLLIYLEDKANARRPGREGLPSLENVAGTWDQLKFEGQCSDPLTFSYRPEDNIVAIEGFYSAPGADPVPALFDFRRLGSDSFQLTNVTAETFPNVVTTSDYRISMRNNNVFCLDEIPIGRVCSGIFHRCNREH